LTAKVARAGAHCHGPALHAPMSQTGRTLRNLNNLKAHLHAVLRAMRQGCLRQTLTAAPGCASTPTCPSLPALFAWESTRIVTLVPGVCTSLRGGSPRTEGRDAAWEEWRSANMTTSAPRSSLPACGLHLKLACGSVARARVLRLCCCGRDAGCGCTRWAAERRSNTRRAATWVQRDALGCAWPLRWSPLKRGARAQGCVRTARSGGTSALGTAASASTASTRAGAATLVVSTTTAS